MRIAFSFLAVAAAFAALPACSSSSSPAGGGDPGTINSGVSDSKSIDDLSDSDVIAICKATREYSARVATSGDAKQLACNFQAMFSVLSAKSDAEAQSLCKNAHDSCMASTTPGSSEGTAPAECTASDDSARKSECAGKGVTVGDVTACTEEQMEALKPFFSPTFCASVKLGTTSGASTQGPACAALAKKCPAAASSSN